MIGHKALIRMRQARKRPKAVWVWVGMDKDKWAASWHLYSDLWAHPNLNIEPTDNIKELDLRFLVGLQVHIHGDDTNQVYSFHAACIKAGAKDIFTFHQDELIHDQGEEIAVS